MKTVETVDLIEFQTVERFDFTVDQIDDVFVFVLSQISVILSRIFENEFAAFVFIPAHELERDVVIFCHTEDAVALMLFHFSEIPLRLFVKISVALVLMAFHFSYISPVT